MGYAIEVSPSTTNKKILYLITKSYFGGAQRYVLELAVAMKEQGYQVAVACGDGGELITRLNDANIQVYIIKGSQRDISFFKEIQAFLSLFKIILSYRPDIVHANSSKAGLLGSFAARLASTKRIVFTAHGWPFLEPRKRMWQILAWIGSYFTALLSHQVILVSYNDKKRTNMPGVLSKTTVIHTAIADFPLLSRTDARNKLFSKEIIDVHFHNVWLVTHGEINNNKNHTTVIDAVAEFNSTHQTKIFYTIIGSGELKDTLEEQISLKGLTEYVNFLGYKEEARQYLLAFDMYIIPSLKEGLPYSLLEAAYSGLPCIASHVGGMPEVITHKESGLLINPLNHMSIVEALDYLLTNPDKRSLYSENLTSSIKTKFNLSEMIIKTKSIYLL